MHFLAWIVGVGEAGIALAMMGMRPGFGSLVVLESLTFAERSALVLFEVEGMSAAELADGFGVPVGTIYRRLHAARRAFAASFRASEEEAPA